MSPTAVEQMSDPTGRAPLYQIRYHDLLLQPVLRTEEGTVCPAEGWRRITDVAGFYSVLCRSSGLRHTGFPDPITRRRMRAAYRNHKLLETRGYR